MDKIVQDLDRVLAEVAKVKALKKGLVRIAAPQLLSCTLLPEFVAAYPREHPARTTAAACRRRPKAGSIFSSDSATDARRPSRRKD